MKLLIINPGSTSTKLALYDGAKKLLQENLEHDAAALQQYHGIGDQVPMRLAVIRDFLDRSGVHPEELAAVIGRGGLVFGLKTGGYLVNEDLCHALVDDDLSQPHASNLGGLLAREIAAPLGIPAYIYDAVTSGELTDVAKITGFVDIERRSFCHVLNSRAMALRYAREHGKHYEELNLIVANRQDHRQYSLRPRRRHLRQCAPPRRDHRLRRRRRRPVLPGALRLRALTRAHQALLFRQIYL